MDLALLCPFPVGVVDWSSPEPRRTVIVKATFTLDRDGELRLAPEQRPLDLDRPSRVFPDELEAASDFAPHKERVDVLLCGHAHAAAPTSAMALAFEIGEVSRSFVALSAERTTRIPLSAHYLRMDASPSSYAVRVGPLAPQSAPRRARAGDHALDRHGAPVGPLGDGFDFAFFNAAPLPQQLDALRPGTELTLTGLLPRATKRAVVIPRRRPLVYLMDSATERGGTNVSLRCDTVVIDTDRVELSLVWRGSFDASAAPARTYLLVAFEPVGTRWSLPELRHHLERASRGEAIVKADPPAPVAPRAAERPPTFDSPSAPPSGRGTLSVGTSEATLLMTGPARQVMSPLPFRAADESTTLIGLPTASTVDALPFLTSSEPRAAWPDRVGTVAAAMTARAPVLPFLPRHETPPSTPASTEDVTVNHDHAKLDRVLTASLPFSFVPPPAPVSAAPRAFGEEVAATGLLAKATASEAPRRTFEPSRLEPELLTVDKYAAIRAELSHGRRREVLAQHGIDAVSWRHQERMQIAALEQAALDGRTDRAAALMKAIDRAELE